MSLSSTGRAMAAARGREIQYTVVLLVERPRLRPRPLPCPRSKPHHHARPKPFPPPHARTRAGPCSLARLTVTATPSSLWNCCAPPPYLVPVPVPSPLPATSTYYLDPTVRYSTVLLLYPARPARSVLYVPSFGAVPRGTVDPCSVQEHRCLLRAAACPQALSRLI